MDLHLENVLQQYNRIKENKNELSIPTISTIPKKFTIQKAKARLNKILKERDSAYEEENNSQNLFHAQSSYTQSSLKIDKNGFFAGFSPEQRDAGEYFLTKLLKKTNQEQMLMLLHGPPGSGKSTFIKRIRDFTNIPIKITATSGVAASSLQGITIDHLMGKGF